MLGSFVSIVGAFITVFLNSLKTQLSTWNRSQTENLNGLKQTAQNFVSFEHKIERIYLSFL